MSKESAYYHISQREGTSQQQRKAAALDPAYFQLEERTIAELIAFGQQYANSLLYFNQKNEIEGNWSAFLAGDPQKMETLLEQSTPFDKEKGHQQPHLALFLSFLQLLREVHQPINELTRKQLDFYFKKALGATTRPGKADQVHLLANLSPNEEQAFIPKGTLVLAGKDKEGNPIQYQTDQDFLANEAKVAHIRSLFVEKELTDIQKKRLIAPSQNKFREVLKLIYRKPGTENELREFYLGNLPLTHSFIEYFDVMGEFVIEIFYRVSTFQRIITIYENWQNAREWEAINIFLKEVYSKRLNTTNEVTFDDTIDFDANFETTFGFDIEGKETSPNTSVFDTFSGINNIYEFYDKWIIVAEDEEKSQNLKDFLKEQVFFTVDPDFNDFAPFNDFMENRLILLEYLHEIEQHLREVNRIEEGINLGWNSLEYERDNTLGNAFNTILEAGGIPETDDEELIMLGNAFSDLEAYFHMSADEYFYIRRLYKEETPQADWKWAKADALLEKAYKKILDEDNTGLLPQQAELTRWKTLYQASDTTKLIINEEVAVPQWKLFGGIPAENADSTIHHEATIGWGLCSPNLALSEGKRELSLVFTFEPLAFEAVKAEMVEYMADFAPFLVEVTTEKKWIPLTAVVWTISEDPTMPQLTAIITATEELDAFAPLEENPHNLPWPSLRLLPNKREPDVGATTPKQVYELFQGQHLTNLALKVAVSGLKSFLLETKEGLQDPQKPFDPFGTEPELGDRIYLTHTELASFCLDELTLRLDWKNLPAAGFSAYYAQYISLGGSLGVPEEIDQDSFKVDLTLVEGQKRVELFPSDNQYPLFPSIGEKLKNIEVSEIKNTLNEAYQRKIITAVEEDDLTNNQRYLELELNGQDFMHKLYFPLTQVQSIRQINDLENEEDTGEAILFEPFKPTLKSIQVDYKTSLNIDFTEVAENQEDFCFHLEPFGLHILQNTESGTPLLPVFEEEGSCYIGLVGLRPPQAISFLFQLAEGSANPDRTPADISWSYLSKDEWKAFDYSQDAVLNASARLLQDTTNGLSGSGLIRLFIPQDASLRHQRMPGGCYWIRLQVNRYTDSLCDALDIKTQALSATWLENLEDSTHLFNALPPDTITSPVAPIEGLADFAQPYHSFGGKPPESDGLLYKRFSERLRHKERALTMWDYERLVLAQFPDIHMAKAFAGDFGYGEFVPGEVRLILVPDISQTNRYNPFEPKVAVARLAEIQNYLQQRAPVFARVKVQNPRYRYLKVRLSARFYDSSLFGFYAQQLEQEISTFLSPWLIDPAADIVLGTKLSYSALVDFIEHRPYVDYITQPKLELLEYNAARKLVVMEKTLDKKGELFIAEPDIIVVSTARHFIDFLDLPTGTNAPVNTGINFNKVEYDFRVKSIT